MGKDDSGARAWAKSLSHLSISATLNRHIHERARNRGGDMRFQFTTAQTLRSFAGAAIFGLGMDVASLVSCHLTDAIWFTLREGLRLLFWGVLNSLQAAHAQVLGHDLFFLGCPLQILHTLGSLAHLLSAAV